MVDRDHGMGPSPGPSLSQRVTLDVTLGEVYRLVQDMRDEQKDMSRKQDEVGRQVEDISGRLQVLEDRGARDLWARFGNVPGLGAALLWFMQHFKS